MTDTAAYTANDVFNLFMNDKQVLDELIALSKRYLPSVFTACRRNHSDPKLYVLYEMPAPFLGYAKPELFACYLDQAITALNPFLQLPAGTRFVGNARKDAIQQLMAYALAEVRLGNITMEKAEQDALTLIYAGARPNIAAACRETGLTRRALQTLMSAYDADTFRRYLAVQQGQRYENVMGDCIKKAA